MWAGYRSTRALRCLCACFVAEAAGRPLSVVIVVDAQHRTRCPNSERTADFGFTMKSLPALVVIVLAACVNTHSGNTVRDVPVNNLRVRSPIYRPAITYIVTPVQLNHMVRRPVYGYGPPGYMFNRQLPYIGLKAPELTMLTKAIDDIKKRSDSELDKIVTEIPLPLPYAESARHPLGNKQKTKQASAKKIKDKSPHRLLPPPLVRSLEPDHYDEEGEKEKLHFAMTPADLGYYFKTTPFTISDKIRRSTSELPYGGLEKKITEEVRDIRQNPIPKTSKTLVAEDLDKLRRGLDSDNLGSTAKPKNESDIYAKGGTGYWVIISAAASATLILSLALIMYGFYVLMQRAKGAAAVDYPAYGVTGPTADPDGDRRLAQSAQMYHYQHQKQQILAMERNLVDQRNGSLSGPESDDEIEEGDYTVYECPGCAATGDMEVKNPMFDQFTPATPGKVQVVQTQPKE